ncbi:MAG: hypothetical protein LBK99_00830 [Opitutaceae bacterium]|jgi:hypothetical protein|nr:hypothetical protein [Opitutaceae bacterium]
MKKRILFCIPLILDASAFAQNNAEQSPITMEQLMGALRIQGGNWKFAFERPVFAKVTCSVSSFPDGKTTSTTEFITDFTSKEVSLFFMTSAAQVGEYPRPDRENGKTMKVRLSNCKATDGTRVIYYIDKFAQRPWVGMDDGKTLGEFIPSIARDPEMNKEYVLYYYFKEGDPYEAKATICFLRSPDDAAKVEKFDRKGVERFERADRK